MGQISSRTVHKANAREFPFFETDFQVDELTWKRVRSKGTTAMVVVLEGKLASAGFGLFACCHVWRQFALERNFWVKVVVLMTFGTFYCVLNIKTKSS